MAVENLGKPKRAKQGPGFHTWRLPDRRTAASLRLPKLQQPAFDFDEAVLGAYYSSYCVSSNTICSLDYIRAQGNGCLCAAIKILGSMQITCGWDVPGGTDTVFKQYGQAISLLNSALACPHESKEDRTLLATLSVTIVEMKTSPDFSLKYWMTHTNGAAALTELRGATQISSRIGAAMFLQTSSQIVIECILGKRHVPQALQSLRKQIEPYVLDLTHPLWHWHGLMYHFVDFWANASRILAADTVVVRDAQIIITEALDLKERIERIFYDAGSYWEYSIQPGQSFLPLVDYEHIYPSLLTSRVWNDRRSATILLLSTITTAVYRCPELEHYTWLYDSSGHPVQESITSYAHDALQTTAKDILAAIPQAMAGLGKKQASPRQSNSTTPTSVSTSTHSSPGVEARGLKLCGSSSEYDENVFVHLPSQEAATSKLPYMDTCKLQWPVYFAVKCELVETRLRVGLLEVLEDAARILQMAQFRILADEVRATLPEAMASGKGYG